MGREEGGRRKGVEREEGGGRKVGREEVRPQGGLRSKGAGREERGRQEGVREGGDVGWSRDEEGREVDGG